MTLRSALSIVLLAALMVVSPSLKAGGSGMLFPGEELTYRVSYLNISLGTIKTLVEPYTTLDGKKVAKVKIWIDSHPSIPFVSLHSVYTSWMDTSATFSYKFQANTDMGDNVWEFDEYNFDYTNLKATLEKWRDKKKVSSKSAEIKKRQNDGSSLLFAARAMLYSKKSYRIPTVIMDEIVSTVVNFQGSVGESDIDAVDYPVRTVYLNGDADWTGIYGLTGRFEGWFSDDEASIPVRAKMNLYVGSVTIELQSWKRGNWQPPKAQ